MAETAAVGAAKGNPVWLREGVPVYRSGQAPDHLRSKTWLGQFPRRLKPAGAPLAWVDTKDYGLVALYDPADVVQMRPLPSQAKARLEREHTCTECGQLKDYRVRGRCQTCQEVAQKKAARLARFHCRLCRAKRKTIYPKGSARLCRACLAKESVRRRTCVGCGTVRKTVYPQRSDRLCRACLTVRAQRRREELAAAVLCRGEGCTTVVATKAEARRAWRLWRLCPPCTERREVERAEERRREIERRRREVEGLAAWARDALADPAVVILDTETTGLGHDARIVEISVITSSGEVLLDTLVNPGVPIPPDATDVHGITDEMVTAPGVPTFSDILVKLTGAIDRRRTLIYNDVYDVARLRHELTLHYTGRQPDAARAAAAWLDCMRFEDVMIPYSDWVGDWSEYHGNFAWQRLDGGHRALGDCRAVVRVLERMRGPEAATVPVQGGDALVGMA